MRSLYIHLPFCVQKCRYCDFASYAGCYDKADAYINTVIGEMKHYPGEQIATVYLGGGTPSSLDEGLTVRLMDAVRTHFCVAPDAEITIEANPATMTREKLAAYRKVGINRISIGVQTFDHAELRFLGRLHSAEQAKQAYALARESGFDNVSMDLMFGLPGQSEASLASSISQMVALQPEHISCYGLKIEEGTPLYADWQAGVIAPMEEDAFADRYEQVCKSLADAGYAQYEISNFSRPGYESRHNSTYWRCGEYIGVGAGAASYYEGKRYTNTPEIDAYLAGVRAVEEETLTDGDRMSEFVILGLRMVRDGISTAEFRRRFGRDIDAVFGKQLKKHAAFIRRDGDVLTLAPEAYYVSNAIFADFI